MSGDVHGKSGSGGRRAPARTLGRWLALCAAAGLDAWLLGCLLLPVCGAVADGRTGRVEAERMEANGGPVLYAYSVDGRVYHGWRRGLEWGGEEVGVVYVPCWPAVHLTSTRLPLDAPGSLWSDPDYLVRIAVLGLVAAAVNAAVLVGGRWRARLPAGWSFLPGLDERRGPRP